MRIIREVKPEPKEFKIKCYKCKTKFAYSEKDIDSDRDRRYVMCPSCTAFLAV